MSYWNEENYRVTLEDFVERFIPHNYTVNLYIQKKVDQGHEWKRLWRGMDWQITDNDSEYFRVHKEVLPCPYFDRNVIGICGLKDCPDAVDEVSIILDMDWKDW